MGNEVGLMANIIMIVNEYYGIVSVPYGEWGRPNKVVGTKFKAEHEVFPSPMGNEVGLME